MFTTHEEFALLEERARLLREVGNGIKGGFIDFLAQAQFDCPTIVNKVI